MKILAISKRLPTTKLETIQALQVPEAREVWRLLGGGALREIHFDKSRPCAILVLEAEDIAAAEVLLAGLPMVIEGQLGFDFYMMGPYRQLEHLFAG